MTRSVWVLAALGLAAALAADVCAGDDDGVPISGDDFVVTGRVKIKPGVYRVADKNGDGVIHVKGDGTTLDLTGVTLIGAADDASPDAFAGVGVSVDGAKDVTINGGAVRGFKIGVRAHDAPGVHLASIDASGNYKQHLRSTVEREDASDWLFGHENDDGHWERDYGAGIALANCAGATVESCVVHHGQNGLLLDHCDKARVFDGDFSFNSGWGVALWRTCDAVVCRNKADFCVRGYSHGRYARGQDSAGVLVYEQCSRNTFALNSATHGGDGFFLYAGNETLKKTGEGGCNDNVVYRNDFSSAVANGIEATFSRGNRFVGNRLYGCDHGVWAGYSWETTIAGNEIIGCASGVSIEHGHENTVSMNKFTECRTAVHLWTDDDPDLANSAFGRGRDTTSRKNRVVDGNEFLGDGVDVLLDGDRESEVSSNVSRGGLIVERRGDTSGVRIDRTTQIGPTRPWVPQLPTLPGQWALAFDAHPSGDRSVIQIDEWGPLHPGESRLFPADSDFVGVARLSVLCIDKTPVGPPGAYLVGRGSFEVTSLTKGFVAEPMSGDAPATIVVRSIGNARPGAFPFEIVVEYAHAIHRARGTVSSIPWDLRFFKWTTDPRTDAEAWESLLSGPPVETRRVDGLDFQWHGEAVDEKVGRDHWGTLATSDVEIAAGKWRLATVSDDGMRVWLDGVLVVDDWTQHGPTPHDVDLDLAAGKHAIRVEHFQIDGWAALRVTLAPVAK